MIFTLVALLILCLPGIGFGKEQAYVGYLSKDRTNSIKGFFIVLVFLTHIKNYILNSGYEYSGLGDNIFRYFFQYAGQLIVVMFLFYSGYGVMESIKKRGKAYVKSMPGHRILSTLLNFDVAILCFGILSLWLHKTVTLKRFLLSLVAWDSLGNSNRYIFAILICYTVTWLCSLLSNDERNLGWNVMIVLTLIMVLLSFVRPPWWSNTILAYPAGILFSQHKEKIESAVNKHYLPLLVVLIFAFSILFFIPLEAKGSRHNLMSIVFAFIVIMSSMRIRVDNGVLRWCGANLFPLYIYQRIPMIALSSMLPSWMLNEQPLIFVAICLVVTVMIAYLYKFFKISL